MKAIITLRILFPIIMLLLAACNDGKADSKETKSPTLSDSTGTRPTTQTPPSVKEFIDPEDTATVAGGESVNPADEKDSVTYCYIKKFYAKNNREYLDADFIQFYVGDKAVEVARKYNEAERDIINGDTVYSLLEEIYMRNDNKLIRSLAIADSAVYMILRNAPKEVVAVATTREKLLKGYNSDRIYVLTIDKDHVVRKIKEQYLP